MIRRKIRRSISSYNEIKIFPVYRNGIKIRNFFLFECTRFKPINLPERYTSNLLGPKDVGKELIKFDHAVFKFINSTMHNTVLDFYMSVVSFCDSKKF